MTGNPPGASPTGSPLRRQLRKQRLRHRRRPHVLRGLLIGAGLLLSAVGGLLLVPLAAVGVPVAVVGLGLLTVEYIGVETTALFLLRLTDRINAKLRDYTARWRRYRRRAEWR